MKKNLLRSTAMVASLALALALVLATGASGERKVECAGNICVSDDGGISPSKLPRHGKAPVTARLMAGVESRDGSHPPALQSVRIDVDKTLAVDAVGLPTCRKSQLEASSSANARRACSDAVVGSGEAEVEVAFPEQAPFRSTGPLILFNGGVKGDTTTVLLHAYVDVPAPTAIERADAEILPTVLREEFDPYRIGDALWGTLGRPILYKRGQEASQGPTEGLLYPKEPRIFTAEDALPYVLDFSRWRA
jgi:hypothetical protein